MDHPRQEQSLADVLSEFARTMLTDFPIQAILDRLVASIVNMLPITSAGVTLISPGRFPHQVAASDAAALEYEQLQTDLGEGPCTAAFATGRPVAISDLSLTQEFPVFTPRALEAGMRAVFAFPLRHGEERLGALDLYRDTSGALDAETMRAAETLADVAAAYMLNAQARQDLRDASDRHQANALHDPLTGLPNRLLLQQRLEHASQRARRSQKMIAVLFVDLDRFKSVNDIYGHQVGDDLLVMAGQRLTGVVRPGDTVARMSGDEFVVLCEDLDHETHAELLAARIVAAMATTFEMARSVVNVTASVGIAFSGMGDTVPEQLLNDADEAMYQAKRAGGARHQLIDLRERSRLNSHVSLEQDLRVAVANRELRLEYQPIVNTSDGHIVAIEALLRWDHPRRGLIEPEITIPLAEQTDLIVPIGRWVLEEACADRARMQEVTPDQRLELSVNVSVRQLMAPNFCETVAHVLAVTGTDPRLVTLEVTESVYVEDSERALVVLNDLKRVGVRLALDDFGTGYSSLIYLQRFPIDIIKVDRTFTAKLGGLQVSTIIIASVIELAHALDIVVIAEGVETIEQHHRLAELGCDQCQGFYFGRPVRRDQFQSHLVPAG